jgi:NADH dehydrogenase ubiquinone Fe-S protein 4
MHHVWRQTQFTNCGPIDCRGLNGDHEAANTNNRPIFGNSLLPSDAVARIYRPVRSAMTSGKARTKKWVLRFDRRTAPFIEPLMGWAGGDDTLTQVELTFPTREAAVAMRSDKVWPISWKSAAPAGFRSRHMTPGKTTRNRARRLRISLRAICNSRGCRRSTAAATYIRSPTSNVRSSIPQPCFVHRRMWLTIPSCPLTANAKCSPAGPGTSTYCRSQATRRCRKAGNLRVSTR